MSYHFHYQIIKRTNTRSTSYSWASIKAVLDRNGLSYELPNVLIVDVRVSFDTREEAVIFRTRFEQDLRIVHRNVTYTVKITKT